MKKINKKIPKIFVWSYLEDYSKNKKKILDLIDKVFQSGALILSKEVTNFEKNFSKFTSNKYGIGVNSGTDALQIALMSIGIKKDDVDAIEWAAKELDVYLAWSLHSSVPM